MRRAVKLIRELITGLVYHAATPAICVLLMLALCMVLIYMYQNEVGKRNLQVSFLDVGQGDAILIQTPNRQSLLIDGGQPTSPILSKIGEVVPFYNHHVDIIMATHPDADHIGGLPKVVQKYSPQLVLESGIHVDTWIDKSLQKIIADNDIQTLRARKGMTIVFGTSSLNSISVTLKILFPDRNVDSWTKKTNNASIVARLEYGSTSFMFTGDSPIAIESFLVSSLQETNVLKVGHHGSRTSTLDLFIEKLSPIYAIISVGKKNRYGHPRQEVLDTLEENNVKVLRTDEEGTITIESDGKKILH